jgi:hypothetical protein
LQNLPSRFLAAPKVRQEIIGAGISRALPLANRGWEQEQSEQSPE